MAAAVGTGAVGDRRAGLLRALVLLGALAVVAGVGLAVCRALPRRTPAGQPPLVRLDRLDPFREAFEAARGQVRIVALLSPT